MVCDGPDPPEYSPQELSPPPRHELMNANGGDESDDENEHIGYEPLPQGPDAALSEHDSDEDEVRAVHIRHTLSDRLPSCLREACLHRMFVYWCGTATRDMAADCEANSYNKQEHFRWPQMDLPVIMSHQ